MEMDILTSIHINPLDIDSRVFDYYEQLKEDVNYTNYDKKELFNKAYQDRKSVV
jgi:hypothetical protein